MIHKHILKHTPTTTHTTDFTKIAKAAEAIADADVINRSIREGGNWTLLPSFGILSSVLPASLCSGWIARPQFPTWLGKNSSTNKNKRLLRELRVSMALTSSSVSSTQMITSGYAHVIYTKIVLLLMTVSSDTHTHTHTHTHKCR
eukprot:GHVR01150921.1.p1 GENE.GHVR01150921.1~~GHVR01150921.1.p1  ORF type:complete len:145 (-),score=47.23 GHVR01150921.1:593-1027(-)